MVYLNWQISGMGCTDYKMLDTFISKFPVDTFQAKVKRENFIGRRKDCLGMINTYIGPTLARVYKNLIARFCPFFVDSTQFCVFWQDFHSSRKHMLGEGGVELSAIILFQLSGWGVGLGEGRSKKPRRVGSKCEKILLNEDLWNLLLKHCRSLKSSF